MSGTDLMERGRIGAAFFVSEQGNHCIVALASVLAPSPLVLARYPAELAGGWRWARGRV